MVTVVVGLLEDWHVSEPIDKKPASGRRTHWGVVWLDRAMNVVITVGGLAVTAAFTLMVVFICWTVVPLFMPAQMGEKSKVALQTGGATTLPGATTQRITAKPLALEIDEYLATGWVLYADGMLRVYNLQDGREVMARQICAQPPVHVRNNRGVLALSYADGTVQVGQIKFATRVWPIEDVAEALRPAVGAVKVGVECVLQGVVDEQVREIRTEVELSEPLKIGAGQSLLAADYLKTPNFEATLTLAADKTLTFATITRKTNIMTGKVRTVVEKNDLPVLPSRPKTEVVGVLLGGSARQGYVVYSDGWLVRINLDDPAKAYLAETVDLLPEPDGQVATVSMLLGNVTLVVADQKGNVAGWFAANATAREQEELKRQGLDLIKMSAPLGAADAAKIAASGVRLGRDKERMVLAHTLEAQPGAVVALAFSNRDRQFVSADNQGHVWLRHMTSGTTQAKVQLPESAPIAALALAPKVDAVAVLYEQGGLRLLGLNNPYPDASVKQLFTRIHYEGYAEPDHTYQSSGGTDDLEMKIGMVPLIFGTLKATFYALLLGVPLAVMGALYCSEFMHPKVRAVVKPVVELMASLPSVVLGFIGALVLAPLVETHALAILLAFILVPTGMVIIGFFWQLRLVNVTGLLPDTPRGRKWAELWPAVKFGFMIVAVLGLFALAFPASGWLNSWFFAGDYKGWLSGTSKVSGTPGWVILLTPLLAVVLTLVFNLKIRGNIKVYRATSPRLLVGALELVRLVLTVLVALGLAWGIGSGLTALGFDLRDHLPGLGFSNGLGQLVGSYMQRNSLMVGILMGFAIIPIIFTVSEDALARVPNSVRSASVGVGATRWQTAVYVVLPVAMSGIFSAIMIGFGRAVGETMVVLMVSGRTPIIDMNIFNGLSALSANIATELPEAPLGSTHYRILFLSALILFVLTFLVNTAAEIVRARFRKKAAAM